MKRSMKYVLAIGVLAGLSRAPAAAAGLYGNLSGVGQPGYCASTSTGPTGAPVCASPVPAGPPTFTGTEYSNFDLGPLAGANPGSAPQTYGVNLSQLGQGAAIDLTTVGTTQTIPNGTVFYYLDGAQAAAFQVTMPAQAYDGQFQNIICEASTAGVLTVAPNAGQSLKGNPGVACAAVTGYRWRYTAANATWYRVN